MTQAEIAYSRVPDNRRLCRQHLASRATTVNVYDTLDLVVEPNLNMKVISSLEPSQAQLDENLTVNTAYQNSKLESRAGSPTKTRPVGSAFSQRFEHGQVETLANSEMKMATKSRNAPEAMQDYKSKQEQ